MGSFSFVLVFAMILAASGYHYGGYHGGHHPGVLHRGHSGGIKRAYPYATGFCTSAHNLYVKRDYDCCRQSSNYNYCCRYRYKVGWTTYESCKCHRDYCSPTTTTTTTTTTTLPTTSTTTPTTTTTTTTPTTTTTTPTTTTTTPTTTTTTPTTTTTTPTTTTTTPTTTTTAPTTTTTIPTSTTTTPTTTTTTTPTTTTTTLITTTTPTTTTTTTSTTTTTPFVSLCADTTFRIINGDAVEDQCEYPGIARATIKGGDKNYCNLVKTKAEVDGQVQTTFITNQFCLAAISLDGNSYTLHFGSEEKGYPISEDLFTITEGEDGLAYFTVDEAYESLFEDSGCQTPACGFDRETMYNDIDLTKCTMVSYGNINGDGDQAGLMEAEVSIYLGGCSDVDTTYIPEGVDPYCFKSESGDAILCSATDSGAPVYCEAKSNGEKILVGVTATETSACGTRSEFEVIPYPS